MKTVLIILFITCLFSCIHSEEKAKKLEDTSNIVSSQKIEKPLLLKYNIEKNEPVKNSSSKHHIKSDSLIIHTEIGKTLRFSKNEINEIIDNHPEFFDEFISDPNLTYHKYANSLDFSSEVGQDAYFILYAYFLKQRNEDKKYAQQRLKLIDIFSKINSLYANLQHGGTYFGHQIFRIPGYVEYAIYIMPKTGEQIDKTYKIDKQKAQYINSLKQLIEDENKIDFDTKESEKSARLKKLNKLVDELEGLITDLFYLRQAQKFQYTNYQYY